MKTFLIAGLGFGDESKGACVDALTRYLNADLIVRYGGGCQCAHNVITPEGVHHTFSQFGAGMLANNKVRTHLSRFMLIEPFSMMREAAALSKLTDDVWGRTTVDGGAVIITAFHRLLNRLRESARGDAKHGSCGRGIGVAREMELKFGKKVLRAKDTCDAKASFQKVIFMAEEMLPEIYELQDKLKLPRTEYYEDMCDEIAKGLYNWPAKIVDGLEPAETMVFEGAQGVMLDEKHGTAPHNTWTNTTFENADTLLDEIGCSDRYRIGCLRTYYTRHGAGPFPTESRDLDLPEPHNVDHGFQGTFRVGMFDWNMAHKAIRIVGGVDGLALSHLDYLPELGWEERKFLEAIHDVLRVPVVMKGRGPTAAHRELNLEVPV